VGGVVKKVLAKYTKSGLGNFVEKCFGLACVCGLAIWEWGMSASDGMMERFMGGMQGKGDAELAEMALGSPAVHFATCVTIHNKDNEVVRAVPNILQLRMSEVYEMCMALGVACRMIVCKPRQVGCSTFASHIVYHHGMRWRTAGITISDKADNSTKLMLKVRDYGVVDRFPWGVRQLKDTSRGLSWTNGTRWEIDSAENWKAGIGDTRQAFHASEAAKWPKTGVKNDKRVMSAVLPSISKGRSVVIAESTPEGAGGWFYDTWQEAVTLDEYLARRRSGVDTGIVWIKVFAAWYEFLEHRRRGEVGEAERREMERSLSDREVSLLERGIGWDQLAWRRDMIRTECGGSEDIFDEYYPEDEVRCFAVSGRPRFDVETLMLMERRAKGLGVVTGHLVQQETGVVTFSRRHDGGGDILVWEEPREGLRYLVGCDPATGEDQTTGKNPDRTSIGVWRQGYYDPGSRIEHRTRLVARVRPPFFGDGDEVAGHILRLCKWYGGAIAVIEVNMGIHVVDRCKEAGVPLYQRRVPSARVGTEVMQYGWKLKDAEQRRQAVDALAVALREGVLDISCEHMIRELKMFVVTKSGREEARGGEHDDDVLMAAMCWASMASATEYRRVVRRRRKPADWDQWKRIGSVGRGY